MSELTRNPKHLPESNGSEADEVAAIIKETKDLDARLDILFANRSPITDFAKRRAKAKKTANQNT